MIESLAEVVLLVFWLLVRSFLLEKIIIEPGFSLIDNFLRETYGPGLDFDTCLNDLILATLKSGSAHIPRHPLTSRCL